MHRHEKDKSQNKEAKGGNWGVTGNLLLGCIICSWVLWIIIIIIWHHNICITITHWCVCVCVWNITKGHQWPSPALESTNPSENSQSMSNEPIFLPLRRRKPYEKWLLRVQHWVPLPFFKNIRIWKLAWTFPKPTLKSNPISVILRASLILMLP